MRKKFLSSYKQIFWVFLLGIVPNIFAAPCGGPTVNWHNLSGCSSSGVVSNVINSNIDISGTNALVNGISVQSLACDILITITSGDSVITGSRNRCDGAPTNPSRLYLYASLGRTITFQVSDDLSFEGNVTSTAATPDLLVTVSGAGTVVFLMDGGTTVSFTQSSTNSGGTQFYVGLGPIGGAPTVQFAHSVNNPTLPFNVDVGPESIMGYISDNSLLVAEGEIEFSPGVNSSSSVGGVLTIENTGAVIIGAYFVSGGLSNPNLMISNISLTTLANGTPQFTIDPESELITPGNTAALQIVNGNTQCTDLFSDPFCQHNGSPNLNTPQTGFILVAPSTLTVSDGTYLEYIGTATNVCCIFTLPSGCGMPQQMQRLRNGSAFIVDGLNTNNMNQAQILLEGTSALYFLSGVDNCGNVSPDYIVAFSAITPCAGNIVFDVEAYASIIGNSSNTNVVNILSLEVNQTGCPVTENSPLLAFPQRTFAVDAQGNYLRYNSGAFLINNRLNLSNLSLTHNDFNHAVFEEFNLGNPNLFSEPTYVGGDSYLFSCHAGQPRPLIAFYNSAFRVQTSVASTGVDFLVPNLVGGSNNSSFIFYNNGRCIDDGYGRNMILGTDICFDTCITTTDMASHLNIYQEVTDPSPGEINLYILTAVNDDCTIQGITGDISNQFAIQTIYLNNETNISIGTNGATGIDVNTGLPFVLTVTAALLVESVYISFESRGGELAYPPSSATTGQGGIFVDALGQFQVLDNRIANIGAMIATSRGGVINLPYNSVFFDPEIGVAQWNLNLNDPTQVVIIAAGQTFSDYTLDWGAIQKAYCCDSTVITPTCFIPYEIEEIPAPCAAAPIIPQNLNALPTVQGTVDQLQILRARIGDPANILVDGGLVRELVFIQGYNSAQAPTGLVVVQNDGYVGLGTTHKDIDALQGSVVLGVNGVTLVPNGDGTIELNEDIIVNNVCHILTGTNFGVNGLNVLHITASTPRELRIKAPGVLDLSQFTTPDQILSIDGAVSLICEPGARIVLGGGTLLFTENAQLLILPSSAPQTGGTTVDSLDNVRVIMSGTGTVNFAGGSSMLVPLGGYFGIESYPVCSNVTDLVFELTDEASIQIGNSALYGGVFQIGDTTFDPTRSVSFQLLLAGAGATFNIDRLGFFGVGVGMIDKSRPIPNEWLVSCLSNITTLTISVNEGTFVHNKIFNGNNVNASLLALGSQGSYSFLFNPLTSVILGGGNMVQIECTEPLTNSGPTRSGLKLNDKLLHLLVLSDAQLAQINNEVTAYNLGSHDTILNIINCVGPAQQSLLQQALDSVVPTSINPTVSSFAGFTPPFLSSGMMAGEYLLTDPSKGPQPTNVTAANLFSYLKTDNYAGPSVLFVAPSNKRANFAPGTLNVGIAGFVSDGSLINRIEFQQGLLLGRQNNPTEFEHSFAIGAVNIIIDPDTDSLSLPTEIIGAAAF